MRIHRDLACISRLGDTVPAPADTPHAALRPKENELLAVPASKVYDRGTTMTAATLLDGRDRRSRSRWLNPATAGETWPRSTESRRKVSLNGAEYEVVVKLDESLSTGVVLVYRSFGIPIFEPVSVRISVAEKARGGI